MSDDDSEDDRTKTAMASWGREQDEEGGDNKEKSKVKAKKKKKKKEKSGDEGDVVATAGDNAEVVEKKEKKKKKKTKEKKEKSKDKDAAPSSPTKSPKKKDKKKKEKEKGKKSKKKKKAQTVSELAPIAPPPVQDQVDYIDDDEGDASETSGDRKIKELLAQWGDEESDDSDSSDEDDEEETSALNAVRMTKAELGLEDNALDHIVLAAPDFAEAMKEFESMTGIKPSIGGSLKGLGTKTARVGLDNQAYIEILAPDPKNSGPVGAQLMDLEEGSLVPYHYAIRQTDLSDLADDYVPNELGYEPDRIGMFRAGPDGTPQKWEMLFMHGHFQGGTVPYYIDWGDCEHPIGSIPQVGSLKNFVVSCPGGSKVHDLLSSIKDINVVDGELGLEFSFGSPEGTITFTGPNPSGIHFPGYEARGPENPVAAPTVSDDDDDICNDDDSDDDDDDDDDSDEDDDDDEDEDDDDDEVESAPAGEPEAVDESEQTEESEAAEEDEWEVFEELEVSEEESEAAEESEHLEKVEAPSENVSDDDAAANLTETGTEEYEVNSVEP